MQGRLDVSHFWGSPRQGKFKSAQYSQILQRPMSNWLEPDYAYVTVWHGLHVEVIEERGIKMILAVIFNQRKQLFLVVKYSPLQGW